MARENKLGKDLFQCDNILDPITFQELIDTIRCNNGDKEIDEYVVMKELGNIFVHYYDDMISLAENNIDEIIAAVKGYIIENDGAKIKPVFGYEVCYDYNGVKMYVGNPIVFPLREIAEKYKRNYQKYGLYKNKVCIKETKYTRDSLEPCRQYEGKEVYNKDWYFGVDALVVGDYVEEEIVDELMNCLPPTCMRSDCCQLGEPSDYKLDENGVTQPSFATFKKVADNTWEFCGDCFAGENEMRGKNVPYVAKGK